MIYVPPWLELAREDCKRGIMEIPGPEHHPRIVEAHSRTTLNASTDEIPYCSSMMCLWIEDCGLGLHSTKSAAARSWLRWGIHISIPAFGAITVMKRGGSGQPGANVLDAPGHVGLFIDQPTPSEVTILGANQSNQVCERTYPADRILGFRWAG